jgi:hypothetical protein
MRQWPSGGRRARKLGITSTGQSERLTQGRRDVKRTERLLLQREEDSINQLDVFERVVDDIVKLEPLRDI